MALYIDNRTSRVYGISAMNTSRDSTALRLPEELAHQLGVAVATVHLYCRQGRIRSVRVGKLIRIPPAEFQRVVREGVPPQSAVS